MALTWNKLGLVIEPTGSEWMRSHGMLPTAEHRHDSTYRVYFSGRDHENRSLISYAEIDVEAPGNAPHYSDGQVLGLGELGCFDDNGVTPSWVVDSDVGKYLYYIGWNRGSTVRMHLVAGLALSIDGGETFERVSRVPILDRHDIEPLTLNTAPCVLKEEGLWRMWYVSGVNWVHRDLPRYNIKYAESHDGVRWDRRGKVAIDFADEKEVALARPSVVRDRDGYRMWFSHKSVDTTYRIGYAESADGVDWVRLDSQSGIDVSESGWDSEMIEYSLVFRHKDALYMLYNGNGYGVGGIGLAVGIG